MFGQENVQVSENNLVYVVGCSKPHGVRLHMANGCKATDRHWQLHGGSFPVVVPHSNLDTGAVVSAFVSNR